MARRCRDEHPTCGVLRDNLCGLRSCHGKGKRSSSGARKVVESNPAIELNHGVVGHSFLNKDVGSSGDPNSGNYIAASLYFVCLTFHISII